MSSNRLVTVIGATGIQGGGVVSELLKSGGWKVRGITRNVDGEAAKELRSKGVEVVAADVSKKEDLARAMAGSYAVFANTVTSYGEGPEPEIKAGKLLVDAANEQNVSHFIFSSLEDCETISKGTHKVPHFTSKAKVEEYARSINLPITSVQIASYYENFKNVFPPRRNAEGVYEFGFPLPGSAAELGQVVVKALEDKDKFLGKKIFVAGDYLTPNEVAAIFTEVPNCPAVWKQPVKFNFIPREVFSTFPFPGAYEIAEMLDFFHHYGYIGEKINGREISVTEIDVFEGKKVCPSLSTLKEWLEKNYSSPQ